MAVHASRTISPASARAQGRRFPLEAGLAFEDMVKAAGLSCLRDFPRRDRGRDLLASSSLRLARLHLARLDLARPTLWSAVVATHLVLRARLNRRSPLPDRQLPMTAGPSIRIFTPLAKGFFPLLRDCKPEAASLCCQPITRRPFSTSKKHRLWRVAGKYISGIVQGQPWRICKQTASFQPHCGLDQPAIDNRLSSSESLRRSESVRADP